MASSVSLVGGRLQPLFDGGDDVGVRATAAKIPTHPLADLRVGQCCGHNRLAYVARHVTRNTRPGLLEQAHRGQDLTRRAEAALKRVVLEKGHLDRVKVTVFRQPFDRQDIPACARHGEREARQHAMPIDNHGARAAGTLVASLPGARQLEGVPQGIQKRDARIDVCGPADAVETQNEGERRIGDFWGGPLAQSYGRPR